MPLTHVMHLFHSKTDHGHFRSLFRFPEPSRSQALPTTPSLKPPKNTPGHCQFSVRPSSVWDVLHQLTDSLTWLSGQESSPEPQVQPQKTLPRKPTSAPQRFGFLPVRLRSAYPVSPLFEKNKIRCPLVPLGVLWCLLVPCVGSLTFQFSRRRAPSSPRRRQTPAGAIVKPSLSLVKPV